MVVMLERKFDQQLDDLKTELLAMGGAVEKSVEQALYALVERDDQTVNDVLKGGVEIDEWEIQVEEQTLTLLATHAPVAKDLRLLTTVLKINDDLERSFLEMHYLINHKKQSTAQIKERRAHCVELLKQIEHVDLNTFQ